MVLTPTGVASDCIELTNAASKGTSGGRIIPMHGSICSNLEALIDQLAPEGAVIRSERSNSIAPQIIVDLFRGWYFELGLAECSSPSGRRTFLTTAAQKIHLAGGSLRDVNYLRNTNHSRKGNDKLVQQQCATQFNSNVIIPVEYRIYKV